MMTLDDIAVMVGETKGLVRAMSDSQTGIAQNIHDLHTRIDALKDSQLSACEKNRIACQTNFTTEHKAAKLERDAIKAVQISNTIKLGALVAGVVSVSTITLAAVSRAIFAYFFE